jgi:hypothetical protein
MTSIDPYPLVRTVVPHRPTPPSRSTGLTPLLPNMKPDNFVGAFHISPFQYTDGTGIMPVAGPDRRNNYFPGFPKSTFEGFGTHAPKIYQQ